MAVNFEEYKRNKVNKKTRDELELERLDEISDQACEELEHYTNQMLLKYNNLPEGTQGDPADVDEMLSLMFAANSSVQAFKEQQRKMGLRND